MNESPREFERQFDYQRDRGPDPENTSAEVENQHHRYTGSRIPWYVRLIWVAFWCFAVYYAITYIFPNIQTELLQQP